MSDTNRELFHTDLFHAVLENKVPDHPVLNTLLFLYCPMAAKLWSKGIKPVVPYDPVWDAMKEYDPDITINQALERKGFFETEKVVFKYIEAVEAYQKIRPEEFPEQRQVFPGIGKTRAPFRYQYGTDRYFGGDFRNVELFLRTWIFIIRKWKMDAGIPPNSHLLSQRLDINIPGLGSRPLQWPAWGWVITEDPKRILVGLLANENDQEHLLFSLAENGLSHADKTQNPTSCEYLPTLLILNRNGRRTLPVQPIFSQERLNRLITFISNNIQEPICIPTPAINQPSQCLHCGFYDSC